MIESAKTSAGCQLRCGDTIWVPFALPGHEEQARVLEIRSRCVILVKTNSGIEKLMDLEAGVCNSIRHINSAKFGLCCTKPHDVVNKEKDAMKRSDGAYCLLQNDHTRAFEKTFATIEEAREQASRIALDNRSTVLIAKVLESVEVETTTKIRKVR